MSKPKGKKKVLLERALNLWGTKFQLDMLQEECAELIQAVSHYKRRKVNSFIEVLEEIVDVEIMLGQIKLALLISFDKDKYEAIKRKKFKRLEERLNDQLPTTKKEGDL